MHTSKRDRVEVIPWFTFPLWKISSKPLYTHLAPLYKLLSKREQWKWSSDQIDAFEKSKDLLTSSSLLMHFDPKLPLILACDASAYGIVVRLYYSYYAELFNVNF